MTGEPSVRPEARDRGLATAYERHCFYPLLEGWAARFEVQTAMEGPLDGISGVAGVHGACLARRGIKVLSVLPTSSHARSARAIYDATGGGEHAQVRVARTSIELVDEDLPVSDLVVAYDALSAVADWKAYVRALAAHARRTLVIAMPNPVSWSARARRLGARIAGNVPVPSEACDTRALAPVLWDLGHVREHVYFDCPAWRAPPTIGPATTHGQFDYGPERWPYFGGPGWSDELLPTLLRRPGFDGSETKLLPRLANMHAFVVDVRPRTPQARKRLLPVGPKPGASQET